MFPPGYRATLKLNFQLGHNQEGRKTKENSKLRVHNVQIIVLSQER